MSNTIEYELQFLDVLREGMADKNDSELRGFVMTCIKSRQQQLKDQMLNNYEVEKECERVVKSKLF